MLCSPPHMVVLLKLVVVATLNSLVAMEDTNETMDLAVAIILIIPIARTIKKKAMLLIVVKTALIGLMLNLLKNSQLLVLFQLKPNHIGS